ncbi:MAG: DUF4347 domain-containing protein [Cyanobacteriota bacterium]
MTALLAYDAGLELVEQLLSGLSPTVRAMAINRDDDDLATIDAALAGSGVCKLMVLCHGQAGELRLGAAPIRREQLLERAATQGLLEVILRVLRSRVLSTPAASATP